MMSETGEQFVTENISEEIREHKRSSSSSSDFDGENPSKFSVVSWKKRMFGRNSSVHAVLGGGKSADIILWRNMQQSGAILAGVTFLWILFECMDYHLVTIICYFFMFSLVASFVWSHASSFINRPIPNIPMVVFNEDIVLTVSCVVNNGINEMLDIWHNVAFGKDWKKFLQVLAGLWIISRFGNWFTFWTFFYVVFLMLYTAPLFYEKYEDQVDAVAEKALIEFCKYYAVFEEKVLQKILQKIPKGPFFDKKQD